MVDSKDRRNPNNTNAFDFIISKNQSIFNGFFTRIGATEVVLEWYAPNISSNLKNNTIRIIITGGPTVDTTFTDGFYTVADTLNAIVDRLNEETTAARFEVVTRFGAYGIEDTNGDDLTVAVSPGGTAKLATQLDLQGSGTPFLYLFDPDLRPYRYIDFISSQLTYNQNLKDSTTSLSDQNVLVRWYFAYDTPVGVDEYNFPILMGYEPFQIRRLYNPPKQIAWENNMPIGQLSFQVVGSDGVIVSSQGSEWLMTLQISEN
jgi:hypothetical protein